MVPQFRPFLADLGISLIPARIELCKWKTHGLDRGFRTIKIYFTPSTFFTSSSNPNISHLCRAIGTLPFSHT